MVENTRVVSEPICGANSLLWNFLPVLLTRARVRPRIVNCRQLQRIGVARRLRNRDSRKREYIGHAGIEVASDLGPARRAGTGS